MIELKTANEDELYVLARKSAEARLSSLSDSELYPWIRFRLYYGPAISAYYKDELIGAAGLQIVRDGVANVWAVINPNPNSRSILNDLPKGRFPTSEQMDFMEAIVRTFIAMRDILCRKLGIKKIRAYSMKGFGASQRLLRACGFKKMRKERIDCFYYIWER
jgi:RimJ/RimL family protein N-acetyltransferase